VVPADSASLAVSKLLPANVSVSPDTTAFVLDVDSTSMSRSLGVLCPDCAVLDGLVAPKPAFTASFNKRLELPGDVVSATLAGGEVTMELTNHFSFDPLRPSATARGSLTVTISSLGTTLGTVVVDGADTPFPSGSTITRTIPLASSAVGDGMLVTIAIDSPEGDPILIDQDERFKGVATPGDIRVSEIEVNVVNREITADAVQFDLDALGEDFVIDRVEGAWLRLALENPFDIQGQVSATITTPEATLVKNFEIAPGATRQRLGFTREEVQSILRQPSATFSFSGAVSAPSGSITIRPSQILAIASGLELDVMSGEE
jgi:hypothetical protein